MLHIKILAALADRTRRDIFERLGQAPQPVGRLASGLPVSRPAVSQHLKVLKQAGLVREERQDNRRVYRIDASGLEPLRRYLDHFGSGDSAPDHSRAEPELGDPGEREGMRRPEDPIVD